MDPIQELYAAITGDDEARTGELLSAHPDLANARIDAHPSDGFGKTQTFLHLAMPGDGRQLSPARLAIVRQLLDHGAEVDAVGHGPNHGACTPLSLAAWGGHAELVDLLLARGASPDGAPESEVRTRPLDTAARHGHTDAAARLVESGADFSLGHLLMAGLRPQVTAYLDEHPDAILRPLAGGIPPLVAALATGSGAALLPLLLSRGADPDAADPDGRTALLVAIELGTEDAISRLREVSTTDLFSAAGLGDAATARDILASSPERARDIQPDGTTALHYAAHAGSLPVVESLLQSGADPSPRSPRFWACLTPLHVAIQRGHRDVALHLVDRGADLDAHGEHGSYQPTPLHVAARWGDLDLLGALLDQGADMYAGSRGSGSIDHSVLQWIVYAGKLDALRLLFDRGLDLAHPSTHHLLHATAARGHTDIAELLLHHGADPTVVDETGRTPAEVAEANGNHAAAQILT